MSAQIGLLDGFRLRDFLGQRPVRPALPDWDTVHGMTAADRAMFDDIRMDYLASDFAIRTPEVKKAILTVSRLQNVNRGRSYGRFMGLVSGPSGAGKTTTCMEIAQHVHNVALRGDPDYIRRDELRVLMVEAPASCTAKAMVTAFATAVHLPVRTSNTISDIQTAIVPVINELGVKLAIIDEVHHLARDGQPLIDSADLLKSLSNQINATFIWSGLDLTQSTLLQGPTGQQLKKRSHPILLGPYRTASPDQWKQWNGLVRAFETELCLLNHPAGTLSQDTQYLFDRTQGSLGSLRYLLTVAAQDLIGASSGAADEIITRDHLDTIDTDMAAYEETSR